MYLSRERAAVFGLKFFMESDDCFLTYPLWEAYRKDRSETDRICGRIIRDLVESYNLEISYTKAPGTICAVSTLEQIYDKFGYHVLDRTLRLCVGTWEGEINSFSGNILNAIARMVVIYGDAMDDEVFKDHVGKFTVKAIGRTAKDRRPGALGYAEAMLIAYNAKCKYRLSMKKLYGKNSDEEIDEEESSEEENGTE